jgi:methylmalonyl-CoA carboxyltransferase small subunit
MKLNITIADTTYEVDVEVAEVDHASLPPAYPVGSARLTGNAASPLPPPQASVPDRPLADDERICRSPVSGVVVKVFAKAGDNIQAGDSLLLLEAMKMETNITAPVAGVVAAIKVGAGQHVQTGNVLVEFV